MLKSVSLTFASAVALCASVLSIANADEYDLTVLQEEVPSPEQFINALKPPAQGDAITTRGLRRRPAIQGSESLSAPPPRRAVAFNVEFEFDSSDLTTPALRALDNLAIAIEAPELRNETYLLEGHTDSVGGEDYNLWLSTQRAAATKRYLVTTHGINPQRLSTTGLGESRLLDPRRPRSAVNRRVQIVSGASR